MKTINFVLSDTGTIIGGSPDGAAWLADREAKAQAAGRRQGLAEAAEHCQREAESLHRAAAGGLLAAMAKEIQALAEEGGK